MKGLHKALPQIASNVYDMVSILVMVMQHFPLIKDIVVVHKSR